MKEVEQAKGLGFVFVCGRRVGIAGQEKKSRGVPALCLQSQLLPQKGVATFDLTAYLL